MTHSEIIKAWNNQADKHNRWPDLGEDEMLEFAMLLEREACAQVVEASPSYDWHRFACEAAAAIRARGQQ